MDKKEYLKPSMRVVKIGMTKLMSGSSNSVTSTVNDDSPATSAAKSRSWDDDEE